MKSRLADKYNLHGLSSIEGAYMTNNNLESVAKMMGGENPNALFEFFSGFKEGSKVLILGSGGNTLVKELEEKYPKLDFISLDLSYFLAHNNTEGLSLQNNNESKKIDESKNMLSADWQDLPFANSSFDGLFSHFSFPYWGKNFEKSMAEVSRVSKNGAKWLFDGTDREEEFKSTLKSEGWSLKFFQSREADLDGTMYFAGQAVMGSNGSRPARSATHHSVHGFAGQ